MLLLRPGAKFEQGAGSLAERMREPEIAYASARIRPFSLASNLAGHPRKSNSPNQNLLRKKEKQKSAIKQKTSFHFDKCSK
jgi:hypothetical protein